MFRTRWLSWAIAGWWLGTLAVAGWGAERRLATVGAAPPTQFREAARRVGFEVVPSATLPSDADVACLVTPLGGDATAQKKLAEDAAKLLANGKTVIVAFGAQAESAEALEPLLPVNFWSISGGPGQHRDLRRPGSGAIVDAASPLGGGFDAKGLKLSTRYDLHLPYAAIEAGEHRYSWSSFEKGLLNTDWQVHLHGDQEGQLPLLVSGRNGPGRVFVLGANLYDPALLNYPQFVEALLRAATPTPLSSTPLPKGLDVAIPRQQLGPLQVQISNSGQTPATALLAYKISNSEHALLNSATTAISVPAGKTITVPLAERSLILGDANIAATADRALPWRWIRAGLATPDRTHLLVEKTALVDVAAPVTVSVEGQDIRSFDDIQAWPDRELGRGLDMAGGARIYRTVYLAGSRPELNVVVRNGLHNVAPLATSSDLNWKENPTVQGLNDMAFSHGSLRGNYPLYGVWAGKSAARQDVALRWDAPVLVAGQNLVAQTRYRFWERSNPAQYELVGVKDGTAKTLATVKDAAYGNGRRRDGFAPVAVTECQLHVTGLDATAAREPKPIGDVPLNCALTEWEVLGWPGTPAPERVSGQLTVVATDLLTRQKTTLLQETLAVEPLQEAVKPVQLPAKSEFGPVRVDVTFATPGKTYTSSFDVLFIAANRKSIEAVPRSTMGLLCSPGFIAFDEFGKGTQADTQGWGGDDDKIWALTHDFMEIGSRNTDSAARLFTTSTRFSHYTDPWRDFPSGQYFWDWAGEQLEKMVTTGRLKGTKHVHVFLSDRWNGIPVGAAFTWADYIAFDQHLRQTTGHGLKGRSRQQIAREVLNEYGDAWQTWQMNRYADKLLDVQNRLAKLGVGFTVTTHGSFPLVGGELGTKIGQTHKASGTDLFWELRNEDLYFSIGHRFGLVAANPDYESGAYNEWGWVSGTLNNAHWFAETGTVEPSRRQWYSTYFAGRVTSEGRFEPLTKYGYHAQGGFGPKNTENDWQQYYRTMHFTTRVRPEAPTGFGLVVSWPEQEKHMGKQAGALGTGLYVAKGYDNVDDLAGEVYQKLVKNGVPISFVASTHTLRNWDHPNPLLVVDGHSLDDWELDVLDRLNRAGAPIIAIGAAGDSAKARSLFGVGWVNGEFVSQGTTITQSGDHATAFTTNRAGRGATIYLARNVKALSSEDAAFLAQAVLAAAGKPLELPAGLAATPFISNDRLFLALGDQGDVAREVTVAVRPAQLDSDYTGSRIRVLDMDSATELPSRWEGGKLVFTLPFTASDGRLVMLVKD